MGDKGTKEKQKRGNKIKKRGGNTNRHGRGILVWSERERRYAAEERWLIRSSFITLPSGKASGHVARGKKEINTRFRKIQTHTKFQKLHSSSILIQPFTKPTTAQRCRSETEKPLSEDFFSSVLLQFKKHHPTGNLKCNYLGISRSLKLRILMGKILSISLKLNFTPNTSGCYGLITRIKDLDPNLG